MEDEDYFFTLVQASFAQRRKTLRNNLTSHFKGILDKDEINEQLEAIGIDGTRRGESLDMQEFSILANAFYKLQHQNS